ncbi:unnamed protein product [Rotaria sordida]|uniref:Uncharacterized protein n=1 Tax=Rotaria sordida TaxID=392033 RepID=A0A819FKN3_9BILA|nr:unnamed protein product [Rotaria sordida]
MADDCITFEVISVVKIFIELNQIKTKIVVNVVNSLYTDCILEMDFINKYQVNLNNKQEQVQVYTSTDYIMLPMGAQVDNIRIVCRLANFLYLNPYQERQIKNLSQVSSGKILYSNSKSGIKLLQEQIDKALAISQPTSLNQTNAFISAVGLYQKFIKDYAKIPTPILKMTNN